MNIEQARTQMIEQQVRAWEVLDDRVLDILRALPRENFVPHRHRNLAFADANIPLPHGQWMMTPKVEGRVLQAVDSAPSDAILEIGTGSGFLTACLAKLGGKVLSVDLYPDLTEQAGARLKQLNIQNVTLESWDATKEEIPRRFDVIVLTGSLPEYDERFQNALKLGGRLFITVGSEPVMDALLVTRITDTEWTREVVFETVLPPLANAVRTERFVF